ncbi:hypothetical protein [Notoacmeibacter sp. MSK16QG-6]|uniref:hypothetical protein n=1 Tax=Notoacmeibacter sp. MSK16QG-6 TaxID=2957982 RepID=UPI0020A0C407|nr:hypothetical protein [Notoacmeibacter sp. MSK16QG-6]MCP1201116.1 hypothetical protein [Notoacmeibacter sp. MSK16QG-6]
MPKADRISPDDFAVAPRRKPNSPKPLTTEAPKDEAPSESAADFSAPSAPADGPRIQPRSDEETREIVERRRQQQESDSNRLAQLRRERKRELQYPVNVMLDYDTKNRLMRAASENDVSQRKILVEAIKEFLANNGY